MVALTDLVGFEGLYATLCQSLPPVVLLTGPEGIGKSVLATAVARHHGWSAKTAQDSYYPDGLTAEQARYLKEILNRRRSNNVYPFLINLDGVSEHVGNLLLKTLEEPPKKVRFILWASKPTLPTIMSRAMVYPCPPLTNEQVRTVLADVLGWAPVRAEIASKVSGGSVGTALSRMELEPSRQLVINFLRCVFEREADRIPGYMNQFNADHMQILGFWAAESMTGVWSWFTPADVPGLKATPATLAVLSSPSRPRLKAWAITKTLTGA